MVIKYYRNKYVNGIVVSRSLKHNRDKQMMGVFHMGKLAIWIGSAVNRIAYVWLIITEAYEEMFYLTLIDPMREFWSATVRKYGGIKKVSKQDLRTPSEDRRRTLVAS
jgi:hypothetical protein